MLLKNHRNLWFSLLPPDQTMDWSNATAFGGCTSVCIFARCTITASTFGQTASNCVLCATKRRWAANGTSLGVTNSGIWQCEQAEHKKWADDWISFTGTCISPLSNGTFSAAAVQISPAFVLCSRDTTGLVLDHFFPPSSPNLNFFPSSISPTPTSAAATRTFRGREAAR